MTPRRQLLKIDESTFFVPLPAHSGRCFCERSTLVSRVLTQPAGAADDTTMLSSEFCDRCSKSRLRRSEIHNLFEFLISPLIIPCRCVRCCVPAFRLRSAVPAQLPESAEAVPSTLSASAATRQRPDTSAAAPVPQRRLSRRRSMSF